LASHDSFADASQEKKEVLSMLARLNALYRDHKELWEFDSNGHDLEWIEDPKKQVHAYRRKSSTGNSCVCLHNFTDKERTFTIECAADPAISPQEIFNSDAAEFGGLGRLNPVLRVVAESYNVTIPPLATV